MTYIEHFRREKRSNSILPRRARLGTEQLVTDVGDQDSSMRIPAFLGGEVLSDFAIALAVGILVGTYWQMLSVAQF